MTATFLEGQGAPPRVLALDLSITATGIARPDGDRDTYNPGPTALGDIERIRRIRNMVVAHAEEYDPTLIVLEAPFVGGGPKSTLLLGGLSYVVRAALADEGFGYLLVPPTVLKKFATGKGTATKPDMRMALYRRTGIDEADDNRADAAWLRLLGLHMLGAPELDLPAANLAALDKLALPAEAPA